MAYGWSALRAGWPLALLAGSAAYAVVGALLQGLALGPAPCSRWSSWRSRSRCGSCPRRARAAPVRPPRGDLPARMVLATVVVLVLTALAPLGSARSWSGLLATYPLFAAILTAFGHRLQGAGGGVGVLRGLLFGLFSFAGFCLVLAVGLVRSASRAPSPPRSRSPCWCRASRCGACGRAAGPDPLDSGPRRAPR